MTNRFSNLLPPLLMLLLAGLTLWLRIAVDGPGNGEGHTVAHAPDAIVDNLSVTRLDETGALQYALTARRMVHYGDEDSTRLEAPRLVKRGEAQSITITAERGTLTASGDEAFFQGNVLLVREASAAQEELRMRTEALHVLAAKDLVRTDRAVTITEGRSVLSGVGMELDKRSRRFTLFSQVRGRFEPVRN